MIKNKQAFFIWLGSFQFMLQSTAFQNVARGITFLKLFCRNNFCIIICMKWSLNTILVSELKIRSVPCCTPEESATHFSTSTSLHFSLSIFLLKNTISSLSILFPDSEWLTNSECCTKFWLWFGFYLISCLEELRVSHCSSLFCCRGEKISWKFHLKEWISPEVDEDKEKSPEMLGLFWAFSIGRQKTESSDIIPSARKFN